MFRKILQRNLFGARAIHHQVSGPRKLLMARLKRNQEIIDKIAQKKATPPSSKKVLSAIAREIPITGGSNFRVLVDSPPYTKFVLPGNTAFAL